MKTGKISTYINEKENSVKVWLHPDVNVKKFESAINDILKFKASNIDIYNEMLLNMQYYAEYCEENGYITPMNWLENHKHF